MTDNIVITLTGVPHPKQSAFEPATVWLWSIDYKGEEFAGSGYSIESSFAEREAAEKLKWLTERDQIARRKARDTASVLGAG